MSSMKASERPLAKIVDLCAHLKVTPYLNQHRKKVLGRIRSCRTAYMGTYTYTCENEACGHEEHRYESCKNRACSVCSWLPREKWKLQRANDIIPDCPYYHYVFTIPHELSELASQNQKTMQTLLFRSVSDTLKSFTKSHCSKDGAQLGYLLVLHTWSTQLRNHYHIHAAVPGGYLLNGVWRQMDKYMFPAAALATVFRAKLCEGVRALHDEGDLKFLGDLAVHRPKPAFGKFMDDNFKKHWHVHAEVTKGSDASRLLGYLAGYIYKTAIDHSRIVSVNEAGVEFQYRSHDEGDRGEWKSQVLAPGEFLRRFAGHIQPRGFTRLRYYGFLGGGVKKDRLATIFAQKDKEYEARNREIHLSSCEKIIGMSGRMEAPKCPVCGGCMLSPWEWRRRHADTGPPDTPVGAGSSIETIKVCA